MLHIIGSAISILLSTLLFTKRGRSAADLILALWLLLIACHLLCYYLLASNKFVEYPYLLGIEIAMPLLHGPFLYMYIALVAKKKSRPLYVLLHFVPAIITYIALSRFLLLTPAEKIFIYQHDGIGYLNLLYFVHLLILPSGLLYISLSVHLLYRVRKLLSHTEKVKAKWLATLLAGMCIIWISILLGNDLSTFALVDLFILLIAFFGIKQVGLFTDNTVPALAAAFESELLVTMQEQPSLTSTIKYQKSAIEQAHLLNMHAQLKQMMQKDKLFKNADLSLQELAIKMNIHQNTLSQLINTMENKSFYDYINDLRIEEFKQILLLPANHKFTLLALAYEAGFNSKTSFNRNFKKKTGSSPTAYVKELKIHLQTPDVVK